MDGTINFLREWLDYKHGFGNLATEFWLGLEKIHMLTNQGVNDPSPAELVNQILLIRYFDRFTNCRLK